MKDVHPGAMDRAIARSLERAGIEVFRLDRPSGDPPSRMRGKLGPIEIVRDRSCWIADGPLPLAVARALYKHPIGRHEIRIAGGDNRPAPSGPWVVWYTPHGERLLPVAYKEALRVVLDRWRGVRQSCPPIIFHDDPTRLGATGYIDLYHLDSEDSLQVFASTLRAHGAYELGRPAWWVRHALTRENLARAIAIAIARSNLPAGSWDGDTEPMPPGDDD